VDLYFIRHGDCLSESAPGLFTPDGALLALGERQALLTARRLASERFTHILSSPLVRALATASAIAASAGDLPVEVWMALREGYGNVPSRAVPLHRSDGRAELLRRFPRAMLPPEIGADGWDHGGDNGFEAFFARCAAAAAALRSRFDAEARVAVVGHGGCLNYMLHALLGIPPTAPVWFQLDCCSVSRVRLVPAAERRQGWPLYPPVDVELLALNDVSHLADGE